VDTSQGTHPYSYSVVGNPSRAYVWIMSRTPTMAPELLVDICERLTSQHGYDLSALEAVMHY
jgi:lipocalin